jgi:hypothetical protein
VSRNYLNNGRAIRSMAAQKRGATVLRHASNLLVLLAMTAATSHALARPLSDFDVALSNGDYIGAAKQIEKVSDQERSRQGANPTLDAYYGRFFAAAGQGSVAEPYLVRAIAATKDASIRDMLAFELARAREVDGYVEKAGVDYKRLTATNTEPAVRRDATLALARLRLGAAPEEAVALLMPMIDNASPPSARWEAHLLLSRAYAIQGRSADSGAALAAAWQEAPSAAVPADAIAVTAMDMAIDRASANDRNGEIGLIAIGRSGSRFAGVSQIPLCSDLLRPDDTVTVAVQADPMQRPVYSAVRASKPGIAQLFTIPLAVAQQRIEGPALYVTLRCRSAPDANVRFAEGAVRNLSSWLAEKGTYPPLRPIDPSVGDPITQLKVQLQELEAKSGAEAPVLAPTLLQLSFMQAVQSRFGNAGNFAEAKTTAARAIGILTKAGAPAEVLEQARVQTTIASAQNQNIADVTGPAALEVMGAMASRSETTPAQGLSAFNVMNAWQLRPAQRLALADRLLAFLDIRKVGATDAIRQVAELRRASILREIGTVAGMRERLAASGVSADLCDAADRPPSIPPAAITITSDDYPKDLLRRNVTGLTTIELSIGASGKIDTQRMIVSQPSGLFDAITAEKLKAVTLLPAQRADLPTACRGMVQTVRWQMPFQGDFSAPFEGFPFPQE